MSESLYSPVEIERALFRALINEGKHLKVLSAKKNNLIYNEKELRDAAHAEVAQHSVPDDEQRTRKRKNFMNPDEKAQQR